MPKSSPARIQSSRRAFLKAGVLTAGALWLPPARLIGSALAAKPADEQPATIPAGAVQLFVDLERIESLQNVERKFHTVEKYAANPVIGKSEPWEDERSTWGSVIYDDEEKIFKAWYGGKSGRQKEFRPGSPSPCSVMCYATSTDGIHWERPRLGLHEVLGSKANNVVINDDHHSGLAHWESVQKDPLETNPERRYKGLGWSSYDWDGPMSGIYTLTSPDGLRWTHTPEPIIHYHPRLNSNDLGPIGDAHSLMIDTLRKRYVALLRRMPHRAFSVSDDFVNWSSPAAAFEARPHEKRNTIYNHSGFVYGDRYLGLLSYLNLEDHTKTLVNVWLLSSRDGEHWVRPETGAPIIGTGDIGDWDRFNVRLSGAPPIRVGDKLYLYYRNTANRHTPYEGKDTTEVGGGLGLATLRADGFASLAAGYDGGQVTTKPLQFSGPVLHVNAKADRGQLMVEVLDEKGQPLPELTRDDCRPMTVDSVDHVIRWKDIASLERLKDRPVCLRFHLQNARLYSYRI